MKRVISALLVSIALILCACAQQKEEVLVSPPPKESPHIFITETPQVQQTFTPLPTPTGKDVFTFAGVSGEDKETLTSAYYGLRDAMRNGDREYVADMIDYPIWVYEFEEPLWIEDKQVFLQYYDQIFTKHFVEVLSNLEINWDYFMVSDYGIYILHSDDISYTMIVFDEQRKGRITRISYYETDPSGTTEVWSTWTPCPTITNTPKYSNATATATPYWFSIAAGTEREMSTYYGTWIITRYESTKDPDFYYDVNFPGTQIGRKIQFLPGEVIVDADFLYNNGVDQTHIIYSVVGLEYYWYDNYINPLPSDHPDKRDDPLFILVDIDRDSNMYEFEVTKSSRLVISSDGYWFFLDKMSN